MIVARYWRGDRDVVHRNREEFLVGIDPKALWLGARTKPAILVGGALALTLFSGAGAQVNALQSD